MGKGESRAVSKWVWIIAGVLILYIIGRFSAGNRTENAKNDTSSSLSNRANAIISLGAIAGKSRSDVEKVVGSGRFVKNWVDKRAGCTKCPNYFYKGDSLEVIYINGKADRITINKLSNHAFNEAFTEGLGLSPQEPTFKNESVMRWEGYDNFREIMAFNDGQGNINYALIKTKAD